MEETKSEEGEEASLLSGRNRDGVREEGDLHLLLLERRTDSRHDCATGGGGHTTGGSGHAPTPGVAAAGAGRQTLPAYQICERASHFLDARVQGDKTRGITIFSSRRFFFFKFFLPFNSSKANSVTQYGQTAALSQNNKGKIIIIITFKKKDKIRIEL